MSDFLNPHLTRPAVRWTSGDALPAVEQTGPAAPLLVDSTTGRLLVDTEANLTADLSLIESKQDTTNAILTTQAADTALIKGYTNVTKGSGVVDSNTQRVTLATDGPGVVNLSTIATNTTPLSGVTRTSASGKVGLDVNIIAGGGGGGGGGGASAAYNATLPTYTSGASTTLQTDVNGRLITTGGLTDTQLRASAVPVSVASLPLPSGAATSANQTTTNNFLTTIDADLGNVADAVATSDTGNFSLISLTKRLLGKFTALTDGTQTTRVINGANTLAVDSAGAVTTNNAASQVYNYTATGAVAVGTVLIGPIDASQFREISAQVTSVGTGMQYQAQISNDNATWTSTHQLSQNANVAVTVSFNATGLLCYSTLGARYFRIVCTVAQTAGTTTLVAYASQQATPKLFQTVAVTGNPTVTPASSNTSSTGFNTYHTLISAASTNATNVKNSAGGIGTCVLTNTSASFKYFKVFNLAIAPTMGTSTPVLNLPIAPNSTLDVSMSFAGLRLVTGIAYAITGGSALLDTTAVAAGDVIVNLTYV